MCDSEDLQCMRRNVGGSKHVNAITHGRGCVRKRRKHWSQALLACLLHRLLGEVVTCLKEGLRLPVYRVTSID